FSCKLQLSGSASEEIASPHAVPIANSLAISMPHSAMPCGGQPLELPEPVQPGCGIHTHLGGHSLIAPGVESAAAHIGIKNYILVTTHARSQGILQVSRIVNIDI